MSQPIASDLSYECLQMRRLRGEIGPCLVDSTHRRLYRVGSYRPFIADVDEDGDRANPQATEITRDSTLDQRGSLPAFASAIRKRQR